MIHEVRIRPRKCRLDKFLGLSGISQRIRRNATAASAHELHGYWLLPPTARQINTLASPAGRPQAGSCLHSLDACCSLRYPQYLVRFRKKCHHTLVALAHGQLHAGRLHGSPAGIRPPNSPASLHRDRPPSRPATTGCRRRCLPASLRTRTRGLAAHDPSRGRTDPRQSD